jgi:hypothetical protein
VVTEVDASKLWITAAVLLTGCAPAAPPVEYHPTVLPVDEAKIRRAGDALLAKWSFCQVDAAKRLARTTVPAIDAAQQASLECRLQREAWVDSQISPGMTKSFVEGAADGSEHCLFPTLLGYIEEIRSGASAEDIRLWALTLDTGSCTA